MKFILNRSLLCLILTAGLVFSACTDGEFAGSGGEGNLNILDRSDDGYLNGKWIWVEGKTGSVEIGFNPASPRKQLKKRRLSAPLYDLNAEAKYAGSDNFSGTEFTVRVYELDVSKNPLKTETFSVKFYNGSGLIDWK